MYLYTIQLKKELANVEIKKSPISWSVAKMIFI